LCAPAKETGEPIDCHGILRDLHLCPEGALGAIAELAPRDGKTAVGNILLKRSRLARRLRHVPAVAKVLDEPDLDQGMAGHLAGRQPVSPVKDARSIKRSNKAGRGHPEGPGGIRAQVVLVPVWNGQSADE
jgi:hypothetical protein